MEYEALMKSQTWDLITHTNEHNLIDNKWIYKVKYNLVEEIEKYKARLVAKDFSQEYKIYYEETFDSMVKMPLIRLIFSLSTDQGWKYF